METTVYVHLTEERGYYLPFQPGEPATVSETNTAAGTIFIAAGAWIAPIYRRGVVAAIDRGLTDARHTSPRALSALTATYRRGAIGRSPAFAATGCSQTTTSICEGSLAARSFIAARSSRGCSSEPLSRPIAMLVYLHFATAIRRVVGCGRERGPPPTASGTTWLEYCARRSRVSLSTL